LLSATWNVEMTHARFRCWDFRSCRRTSRFAIHRDNGPLAFEEMSEAENRTVFVFDVMRGGHANVGVAQLLLRGGEPVARIDLASELFAQCVERRL
jgi:hypothetical protein